MAFFSKPVTLSATTPPYLSQATALLLSKQVRATKNRLQVLCCLLKSSNALSHLELHALMPELDRVTLYRTLDCLLDAAIVHKIAGNDRVFRYSVGKQSAQSELNAETVATHHHAHFHCRQCGRIFCLNNTIWQSPQAQDWQQQAQDELGQDFQIQEMDLSLNGICKFCQLSANTGSV